MKTHQNKILLGDCLDVLDNIKPNSVDLIYLDPPFFTQKEQSLSTRDGEQFYNFSDKWKDMNEYTEHLRIRLEKCKSVLKSTGSLFLHCDKTASHYIKVTLDTVFGYDNFQSEIIWSYRRWSNSKKGLLNNHQIIFFYSKTKDFKFNQAYDDYSPSTNIDQIVQLRERDDRNKAVYKKNLDGSPVLCKEKKGVPLGDVWDIPYLNPKAKERVGYPTQKPIILLEKIIGLVTDEGDLVLDPYCGSGTTLVSAMLMNRNYIGMDVNQDAVNLAKSRLENPIKSESNLLKKGRDSYSRSEPQIKEIVSNLGGILVHRNKGMDALVTVNGQMVPVKIVLESKELQVAIEQLTKASQKNSYMSKAIYPTFPCSDDLKEEVWKNNEVIIFEDISDLESRITFNSQIKQTIRNNQVTSSQVSLI